MNIHKFLGYMTIAFERLYTANLYDIDKDSPTFFCHLLPGLLHPLKKLSRYWRFSGILTSPPWVNCVVTALLFGLHPEQLAEMIPVEMHEAHGLMDLAGRFGHGNCVGLVCIKMAEVDLDRYPKKM